MIELKKPHNPGDDEPGVLYTHVRIAAWSGDNRKQRLRLSMELRYHSSENGWKSREAPPRELSLDPLEWGELIHRAPPAGLSAWAGWVAVCEQHLIDKGVYPGGKVVADPSLPPGKAATPD